ncbi:hypothetical protein Tdes44962_MAKER07673 [Teratosphaeria destructans]|uniref:Uncharacterized protein n=1 Tax=Teratosphaeria destructans TaxID=418781 RepID=A0A9W7W5G7_9PEZI|nr:hypothetical protein Tdes44962_MAKER07673 [Teratosphaeria destructans]
MSPEATAHGAVTSREYQVTDLECRLVTIAPELRNLIYDYTFTSDDDPNATSLLDAKPPTDELTRTCCQIHDEANGIFRRAQKQYWTLSAFMIDNEGVNRIVGAWFRRDELTSLNKIALDDRCLGLITRLSIKVDRAILGKHATMTLDGGVWTHRVSEPNVKARRSVMIFPADAVPAWIRGSRWACDYFGQHKWRFAFGDKAGVNRLRRARPYRLTDHILRGAILCGTDGFTSRTLGYIL